MNPATPVKFDIVLLGGGHTHVQVLRHFLMKPLDGARITLVSQGEYAPYSGMLPGHLAGHYTFEDTHIDLRRYCQRVKARFVQGDALGVLSFDAETACDGCYPLHLDGTEAEAYCP